MHPATFRTRKTATLLLMTLALMASGCYPESTLDGLGPNASNDGSAQPSNADEVPEGSPLPFFDPAAPTEASPSPSIAEPVPAPAPTPTTPTRSASPFPPTAPTTETTTTQATDSPASPTSPTGPTTTTTTAPNSPTAPTSPAAQEEEEPTSSTSPTTETPTTQSTDEPTTTTSPTTETPATPTSEQPVPTAPSNPPALGGFPFGPFLPTQNDLATKYTGAWIRVYPETVVQQLNEARAAGTPVAVNFVRGKKHSMNADQTFNLDKWKGMIDVYDEIDLTPWIQDGTLLVNYLLDEPKSRSEWGGEVIPNDVLDEMARYSKEKFPNLLTTVRVSPTKLRDYAAGYRQPDPDWRWQYLDSGWAQYSTRHGAIRDYIADEVATAKATGLGLMFGMNVINGGDGPNTGLGWDVQGESSGSYTMSPAELKEFGSLMMAEQYSCGLIMWRYYDSSEFSYFDKPEVDSAMSELKGIALNRPATTCAPNGN